MDNYCRAAQLSIINYQWKLYTICPQIIINYFFDNFMFYFSF